MKFNTNSILGLVVLIALLIVIAIFVPFVFIWALNTLFPVLAIGYNLNTWAAAYLVLMAMNAVRVSSEKD